MHKNEKHFVNSISLCSFCFLFFLLLFFSKAQPSVFMLELQSVKKEPDLLFAWIWTRIQRRKNSKYMLLHIFYLLQDLLSLVNMSDHNRGKFTDPNIVCM